MPFKYITYTLSCQSKSTSELQKEWENYRSYGFADLDEQYCANTLTLEGRLYSHEKIENDICARLERDDGSMLEPNSQVLVLSYCHLCLGRKRVNGYGAVEDLSTKVAQSCG